MNKNVTEQNKTTAEELGVMTIRESMALDENGTTRALKRISQYVTNDNIGLLCAEEDDGKGGTMTVRTLTVDGKPYVISLEDFNAIQEQRVLVAMDKATTTAKYAAICATPLHLIEVTGCKDLAEYAHKILGLERGTTRDYIATFNAFFNSDGTPKSKYLLDVSMSNLKAVLGLVNSVCGGDVKKFETMYIKSGKINLNTTQAKVKTQLDELAKDLDDPYTKPTNKRATKNPEQGEQGEQGEQETDDPTTTPEQKFCSIASALFTAYSDVKSGDTKMDSRLMGAFKVISDYAKTLSTTSK